MRTMANYLIIMFSAMLFVFRIIVLYTTTSGIDFVTHSLNVQFEIIYLFAILVSIILMSKNKLTGAIIFLVSSVLYLGPTIFSQAMGISGNGMSIQSGTELLISLINMVIPLFAFFIIAFAKEQEKRPVDKKTDFFYKNEAYDRKNDDRVDKNNYRIY